MIEKIQPDFFNYIAKKTENKFENLQDNIEKGRMGTDIKKYLAKVYFITTIITSIFAIFFGLLFFLLSQQGLISLFSAIFLVLFIVIPTVGLITFIIGISYPNLKKTRVKSDIEKNLPYGITLMYALSRGGMSTVNIIKEIAKSEESYGELSKEMQSLINDMNYFGKNSETAIRDLVERTPSDDLSEFLQDLTSRIESGANTTTFLSRESKQSLQRAKSSQEDFLETLELLSEMYVTLFVAAPIFVIVILMSLTLIGSGKIIHVVIVIYGILPIMSFGFLVIISTITSDEGKEGVKIPEERDVLTYEKAKDKYGDLDETIQKDIEKMKTENPIKKFFNEPIEAIKENYKLSTIITLPIILIYLSTTLLIGPSPLNLTNSPVTITTIFITVPLIILLLPISLAYEIKSRKERAMKNRLPDVLQNIAKVNNIVPNLPKSLKQVEKETSGRMGKELYKIRNDINITNSTKNSLIRFANRVQNREITRTVKLIVKANETTGQISDVLEIAAQDIRKRKELEKQRISSMNKYIAIIGMSFLIYVGIVVILDIFFLNAIENVAEQAAKTETPSGRSSGFGASPEDVPVDLLRTAFFHSTLIQAVTIGIITGYLRRNNIYSGIKMSIILITISTVIFTLAV